MSPLFHKFNMPKNPTYQGVVKAESSVGDLAANRKTVGLICGGSGVGKTTIPRLIAKRHLIGFVPEDRPDNAAALVSMTWQNRMHPLHILNECNHLLRDPKTMNIIKLLHEEPRRCVHWTIEGKRNEDYKERGSIQYRESIPPTSFPLDDPVTHRRYARQLFTMNENYTDPEVTRLLPQEHWIALLRRGLDPVYIPTPPRSLFEYVVWLSGEGRMLSNLQFNYPTSRDAIAFYVQNVNRLPEISPARVVMVAEIIRDNSKDQAARMLDQMLLDTDQRDLGLETGLVQSLLWPRRPPKRTPKPPPVHRFRPPEQAPVVDPEPVVEPDPESVVEPEPVIEPVTVAPVPTSEPVIEQVIEPEPVVTPEPVVEPVSEVATTWEDAVDLIYQRRSIETCESIAEVLRGMPLDAWEYPDDFNRFHDAMHEKADLQWRGADNHLAYSYMAYAPGQILFVTTEAVLVYEDGTLRILTWEDAGAQIAPQLKLAEEKRAAVRRQEKVREIMQKKLPAKRKLRAVKTLSDEYLALQDVGPEAARAIEFIRGMSQDDERFANCATWSDYVILAGKLSDAAPNDPTTE